jgi:hypothetical protein
MGYKPPKDENVIKKRYTIRRTGKEGSSIQVCIPKEAFEREARRQDLKPKSY